MEAPRSWWPWLLGAMLLGGLAVVWGWGRKFLWGRLPLAPVGYQ